MAIANHIRKVDGCIRGLFFPISSLFFKAIYQQKFYDRLTNQLLDVKIDVCNTRNDRLRDVDILEKVEWYQLKIKSEESFKMVWTYAMEAHYRKHVSTYDAYIIGGAAHK